MRRVHKVKELQFFFIYISNTKLNKNKNLEKGQFGTTDADWMCIFSCGERVLE